MALLVLLQAFLVRRPFGDLVAMTVDHGLRPEAADEADRVAAFCDSHGIPHRTLRWEGSKPSSGVPAAAREARHRLLAEAARSLDAAMVLTGHTANDQAETIAMRRARGSGRGLAGIAPATLYDGATWFVRPLLSHARSALRGMLARAGVTWIEDPTNEQTAYERARARRALAGPGEEGIVGALLEEGRLAALERVDLGRRAGSLIERHAGLAAPGLVRVDAGLLAAQDAAAARLAFRLLVAAVGGREHLPDAPRARGLFERLASGHGRGSLGGAVAERRKGAFYLHREIRAGWTGAAPAVAGAVWDGRFRLAERPFPANAVVEAAGRTLAEARARSSADTAAPPALVRAALAAEPLLHVRGAAASLDLSGSRRDGLLLRRVAAPYARYLPSFDLAPAEALRALLDGHSFPASPWDSHNAA
ncbi:tRNA lysidine(34) synthetase TilS [Aquibium microcysteis]|uniref:tRNA lysidine(34) synthetase TilS n=1 Tax=Aquibium microcysteis TaxID=675281 RepID=UPI00165D00CB